VGGVRHCENSEHNAISLARAQTCTTEPGAEPTSNEATAPR